MIVERQRDARWSRYGGIVVLLLALLLPIFSAQFVGATATVSNCNDNGSGSLRTAIAAGGTITFTTNCLATGPILLTGGSLAVGGNLTVDGTGHTIVVDGNNAVTVFTISTGATASLNNLTIQHGKASINCGGAALCGGGIFNAGSLTLTNTIVTNNQASLGGGIWNSDQALALTLTNSTVSNNTATYSGGTSLGGGIYDACSFGIVVRLNGSTVSGNMANGGGGIFSTCGDERITNSTISGNHASGNGGVNGGIYSFGGGLTVTGSTISGNVSDEAGGIFLVDAGMTMTNSTVSGNSATNGGGGIESYQAAMAIGFTLIQTTLSGNSATLGNGIYVHSNAHPTIQNSIIDNNCAGSAVSGGYNIDRFGSCALTGTGDRTGDPGIGLLANNGGPTLTHLPQAGSQAIDKIPNTGGCNGAGVTTDQRGDPRPAPINGLCDIGSVEVVVPPTISLIRPSSGTVNGGTATVIFGTNFEVGAVVTIGGIVAPIIGMNSVAIRVQTPAHPVPGAVAVVVTNPDGGSASVANGYTYGVVTVLPPPQPPAPTVIPTPNRLPPTRLPVATVVATPHPLPSRTPG